MGVHKLEIYLKHMNISQRGFAKNIGTTPNHLGRLMKGQSIPGLELAYRIQKWTGDLISIDEWLPHELRQDIDREAQNHLDELKGKMDEFKKKVVKNIK
jgi:transcriptional regulator with XRE-family HTH domain